VWTEPILHADMDAFFVEVERRRDPTLLGVPVAVGGAGGRGVIASASYEARRRGVSSAQPTAIALRNCPELVVVAPSHDVYAAVSAEVFQIFRGFTPLVEGLSLDEAFLDVSGLRRHFESPVDVAIAIRAEIRAQLGLPASVGIAPSKYLAKLASEAAKPDGLRHIPVGAQLEFLHALPIGSLWGVGPATLAGLARLGLETVGDLAELPDQTAITALGPAQGRLLLDLARGIDLRPVVPDGETKSISVEETYERDLEGRETIESALLAHSQRLAGRLRRSALGARTLTLKLRYQDFTTITRSITLAGPIDSPRDLFRIACDLLATVDVDHPVRLLGLGGSGLEEPGQGGRLDIDSTEAWHRLEDAVAEVRQRFGDRSVDPARLLDRKGRVPRSDR
jgi:DNA polymerase-4